MNQLTKTFLRQIPKTDLHLHLDGSLRIPTLIELAEQENITLPATTEKNLRTTIFKEQYADLPEYLAGFAYTVAVMQKAEHIERIAYELGQDNLAEGVRYIEVRFAPQLHMHAKLSMNDVLAAVAHGLTRAKKEHNQQTQVKNGDDIPFEFGIIVCALRWFAPEMSSYYNNLFNVMSYARPKDVFATASHELAKASAHLAEQSDLHIVGFDLAGAESGNPAEDHHQAFQHAHDHFLKKTVHAGEAYGPESIFQAITFCHANRIGHGTHLFAADMIQNPEIKDPQRYIEKLIKYIADTRTCIEVNLTSNLQTLPHMKTLANHPLKQMLEHNLSATICTDNRLISNTTITQELLLAVQHLNITPKQLKSLIIAGFKGSFFPGSYTEKRRFVRQAINRYETLAIQQTENTP